MKKGRLSYSSREALRGILFIAPWLIGFVFLFLRPFISAVIYSFNDVDLSSGEVVTLFRGFGNYVDAFADDTKFIMHLTQSLGTMVYQVPLVVFFSLFIATVLNQKFKSRGFFRLVFFRPSFVTFYFSYFHASVHHICLQALKRQIPLQRISP